MNFILPMMPALRQAAVTTSAVLSCDRPHAINLESKKNTVGVQITVHGIVYGRTVIR